ncbi:unnamed protein product [Urochloa decumbens]|uniref:KIB1-4 beta-propeller domain-containing protein n=1 Tax=Urochloa decumbens TaxID=240449 RepID=A0ABC9C8V0_9POAL
MASFRPWASIPSELLLISDGFSHLESYCRARGVCSAWRAALPPPIPSLVTVTTTIQPGAPPPLRPQAPDVSALFLPAGRSYPLTTLSRGSRCVGSSSGWLAVDSRPNSLGIYLVSRLAGGVHVPLLPLRNGGEPVAKVVFAPRPTAEDYVAVAICGPRRLAYTKARDMKWMLLDVAAVARWGEGPRRRPVVEPLLQAAAERAGVGGLPAYDPAAAYAPPYDAASRFTGASRNVFFFGGDLYQAWRNTTGAAVSWAVPGGGKFGMAKDEVFVLKYDPERRRPCWDAVKDLGGCSVFVGKNQPVVLRAQDTPGVRPNCVYWINERSRNEPMIFDMANGTSTVGSSFRRKIAEPVPVCWYFLYDKDYDCRGLCSSQSEIKRIRTEEV